MFHNPYHFVPVAAKTLFPSLLPGAGSFPSGLPPEVTHDHWDAAFLSGRLVVRLTAETPLVVGGLHFEPSSLHGRETPGRVEQFMLGGLPAIPGSSLRGMIASVAEAVSNSALRMLGGGTISFRQRAEEALTALGMVRIHEGRYYLEPLCLPTLKQARDDNGFSLDNPQGLSPSELKEEQARRDKGEAESPRFTPLMFPSPTLKVYFGDPDGGGLSDITSDAFLDRFPSHKIADGDARYWRMKLVKPGATWMDGHRLARDPAWQKIRGSALLAQHVDPRATPLPEPWQAGDEKRGYTRGILRVLGVSLARREKIPLGVGGRPGKKHEIFIPYSEESEKLYQNNPEQRLPITVEAVNRLTQLAGQRTEDNRALPFEPNKTARHPSAKEKRIQLKDGDIVFWRPNACGNAVSAVSLSSIWRDWVPASIEEKPSGATPADFFASISPDLLPVGMHPDKCQLTMAERLFGFVAQADPRRVAEEDGRALAGRVRVGNGLPHSDRPPQWLHNHYRTLKILASPKPPSPALYFRSAQDGGHVSKRSLRLGRASPQGRKFYVHHRLADLKEHGGRWPWQTHPQTPRGDLDQRCEVRPLAAGAEFWFPVDFDNLTEIEVGLLCYALSPDPDFRHKLGFAKPLGLGTVKLEIAGLFLVSRIDRYRNKSAVCFYTTASAPPSPSTNQRLFDSAPGERFRREHKAVAAKQTGGHSPADFAAKFVQAAGSTAGGIRQVLALLGDPSRTGQLVQYPQVAGRQGLDAETESYRWWVANEDDYGPHQSLCPIDPASPMLPTLAAIDQHQVKRAHRQAREQRYRRRG
jgi:hypothetical protein